MKKSWMTNDKHHNEEIIDLEGVYPRNAKGTLNPIIPIVFGYPFHYKYKIINSL